MALLCNFFENTPEFEAELEAFCMMAPNTVVSFQGRGERVKHHVMA